MGVSEAVAPADSGTIAMVLCGDKARTYLFLVEWARQRQIDGDGDKEKEIGRTRRRLHRRRATSQAKPRGLTEAEGIIRTKAKCEPFFNNIDKNNTSTKIHLYLF